MADRVELSQLPPLQKLDLTTLNAFVRELNLRLRRIDEVLGKKSSKLALTGDMDAGFNRLTKVATAVSMDDAVPLSQLRDEIQQWWEDTKESLTSEGSVGDTGDETSIDPDPDDDDGGGLSALTWVRWFMVMGG